MAKQPMATIISYCAACGQLIESMVDWSSEDDYWRPPVVKGEIEADVITKVTQIQPLRNSALPCYQVELDTRLKPHCQTAESWGGRQE